ncbi:MAG TPA: DUF1800 domain-containing protein [Chitinophagales bacterium]|nr:DUF1800 domain-containing protein [Chitinophagales bacterium]
MVSKQQQVQHLYLRAGFGETPAVIKKKQQQSIHKLVDELFDDAKQYKQITYLENPADSKEVGNFKVLLLILKSRDQMQELNIEWLKMLHTTNSVLREKMTLFWHNHFATSTQLAYLMQVQNNTLRKNALGKFDKLLHAISTDPAMIIYLNNQQNKKDAPNENFAREVMELFTLGEGNLYTEKDIKEAARAFTGWTVNKRGKFEFVAKEHDDGEKEFMGMKGNFNGQDIINILLSKKQTARYVTYKIYKEFVNDDVDETIVTQLTDQFFESGYDIGKLMKTIFTADWFYDEKNVGTQIASPVELLTRYKRLLNIGFKDDKAQLVVQKVLGQVLFFPPNVAGWPGGKNWVDSSTLTLRMNIPTRIVQGGGFDIRPKPEFEDAPEDETALKARKRSEIYSDWASIVTAFKMVPKESLVDAVIEAFIQSPKEGIDKALIEKYVDHSTDDKRIISTVGIVMSLPEFQLI